MNKRIMASLVALVFLVGFSCSGRKGGTQYALPPDTVFPVLKPQGVFQNYPTFREEFLYYIDLSGEKDFRWQLPGNSEKGVLAFTVYWSGLTAASSPDPPEGIGFTLRVTRENEAGRHPVCERIFKDPQLRRRKGRRRNYFNKLVKQKITFQPGDTLVVSLDNMRSTARENRWGITIPRVERNLPSSGGRPPPNVIVMSIDTLRADFLGVYEELLLGRESSGFSPALDNLARETVVFLRPFTTLSATWPALSSMLLSLYPNEHGCFYNGDFLEFNFYSLADFLLAKGYHTLGLNANAFNLHISGFERKVLFYDDPDPSAESYRNCDEKLVEKALEKLAGAGGRPFFHWYHFMGTHDPYTPPRDIIEEMSGKRDIPYYNLRHKLEEKEGFTPEDLENIRLLYAGELFHLDKGIRRIVNYLKKNGLYENTLLVVTSDHGEDLYQHHRYFYHYPSLYNSGIHIPLLIKFPYQDRQIVRSTPVSILDIFPTLYEYFERVNPNRLTTAVPFSGWSLLTLLRGETEEYDRRILFAGVEEYRVISARYKDWNLIFNPEELIITTRHNTPYRYKPVELYDFYRDYDDRHPAENERIREYLITEILRFSKNTKRLQSSGPAGKINVSDETRKETRKRLKTLGYLD